MNKISIRLDIGTERLYNIRILTQKRILCTHFTDTQLKAKAKGQ